MQPAEMVKIAAKRRGYSKETADTYAACLNKFFRYCKKDPRSVKKADIEEYINRLEEFLRGLEIYYLKRFLKMKKMLI